MVKSFQCIHLSHKLLPFAGSPSKAKPTQLPPPPDPGLLALAPHRPRIFKTPFQCWGRNPNGQCGGDDIETYGDDEDEMGDNLPFVDLGTGRTAVSLSAGEAHVCALLDNGTVKVRGGPCFRVGGDKGFGFCFCFCFRFL